MSYPTLPLQAALLARLKVKLSCPVYDAVSRAATKPYVVIDSEFITNTTPITGRKREERLLYLSVWSDHKGQSEVKRINSEIAESLDEVPLALSDGATAVSVRVVRTESNREPDGVTYMGSVTLRIITQH